ncbi:MAG: ThiF family adenylyltransferase [Gemmatimonadetes bacterium]|nr:ThiF family adenylyltransferase [Gemmatimonadota bacterium]
MSWDVAFTAEAEAAARNHLLCHYSRGDDQEDLCFALWRPSTGHTRNAALIDRIVLPKKGDRLLHGNVSFQPTYLARALALAQSSNSGLAFMHSHPTPGWQPMSGTDVVAERDVLAYPAGATSLPLVGLTIGSDGYWSARFWQRHRGHMSSFWCDKVRVVGRDSYHVFYNDELVPPPTRQRILTRTFDTWGQEAQQRIARLHVGIVGLGSVGCLVAEAIARIGVARVTLIDPDDVAEHNLDRLVYGTRKDIGVPKVRLAARKMRRNGTARAIRVTPLPLSIHNDLAYRSAIDCDIIFSCVDRPLARDVLNYLAFAHLIPVVDGGIAIEYDYHREGLFAAHWRAHLVTPYHQCLRCNGQYSSSMVTVELDGSLDDPSYVSMLPPGQADANQNVFPFSMSAAAFEVNLFLRYLLSPDWWPIVKQQDYQFVTGEIRIINDKCHPYCAFRGRIALGDGSKPPYVVTGPPLTRRRAVSQHLPTLLDRVMRFRRMFQR